MRGSYSSEIGGMPPRTGGGVGGIGGGVGADGGGVGAGGGASVRESLRSRPRLPGEFARRRTGVGILLSGEALRSGVAGTSLIVPLTALPSVFGGGVTVAGGGVALRSSAVAVTAASC
jgi:hypothetical protein